ncbi:SDR family oxidoreductase [Candidatus Pelagibacter sp.]|jgi:NAD(P)-dependent dehydrogenase (short-subunit alcohol dehydrogenase family)|nr:SDR family oxidoreductase [Candidatus Pelagibacter sp.]
MINFKDKNVLITGANGFIGSSLSELFYNLGANLILTDKVKKPLKLKKLINKKKTHYLSCDLAMETSILNFQKKILNRYNRLDVIIHNASSTGDDNNIGWAANFDKQLTHHWDQVFQISLKSNFDINKKFIKLLKKSKNPSIINISSIYGFMAPDWEIYRGTKIKNPAGYGVSKAGLIYLTKWMAKTLAPKIRVNSVSPGGIKRTQSKRFIKKYIKKVPLGRMANETDVVNAVIFLASDMSSYVTGQNIIVDGGISL